jgi:hypothetical protein
MNMCPFWDLQKPYLKKNIAACLHFPNTVSNMPFCSIPWLLTEANNVKNGAMSNIQVFASDS